jgi:alpha-1,3-glucosyltransferase
MKVESRLPQKPMSFWSHPIVPVFIAITLVKILLAPSYYSTDYEVHRNWKAVTLSLRPSKWYFDATSPWTLDYPPLFAIFEAIWARIAVLADPNMVQLSALDHHSWASLIFMRASVMTSDLCLLGGTWLCAANPSPEVNNSAPVLVLLSAGLLLVDHIHFQYNGFQFGVLLLSIGALRKCVAQVDASKQTRWGLIGGAAFAALLGLKHLYLPLSLVYFMHLFFGYCHPDGPSFSLGRFTALGAVVLAVLAAPYLFIILDDTSASGGALLNSTRTQLYQIGGRLFPFVGVTEECSVVHGASTATLTNACHERGLVHAYWAANSWALYLTADHVIFKALRKLHAIAPALPLPNLPSVLEGASATAGLVGRVSTRVLPQITPAIAAALTLLAMLPALVATAAAAKLSLRQRDSSVFERSLAHASLSAFVFGWHVHEKAILGALVLLGLLASAQRPRDATHFLRLSALGGFALFPLFTHPRETPTKLLIFLASLRLAYLALGSPRMQAVDQLFAILLANLFVFNEIVHPLLFAPRHLLEFLPLMLTSTLCSLGICACWCMSAAQLSADAWTYISAKGS